MSSPSSEWSMDFGLMRLARGEENVVAMDVQDSTPTTPQLSTAEDSLPETQPTSKAKLTEDKPSPVPEPKPEVHIIPTNPPTKAAPLPEAGTTIALAPNQFPPAQEVFKPATTLLSSNAEDVLPNQPLTSTTEDLPPTQTKLNFLRTNSISTSLLGVSLETMSDVAKNLTINSYLDNIDAICKRKIRMGHLGDGGWELCDDAEVRPVPPCIIYSFGINRDWSFDDDVSQLYGCHVYAFDPSIVQETHNRTDKIHFYKWGLAGTTSTSKIGWPLYTLHDIRKMLGHSQRAIDVIKMDIERAEWSSLPHMLETGQFDGVKQFLVEYHVSANNKLDQLRLYQEIEKIGFGKFDVHKNEHCEDIVAGFPFRGRGATKCII